MPTGSTTGVALVTGGGARLGRAIALALGERGFDVAVHYRSSAEGAKATAREIDQMGRRTHLLKGDLAKETDVAKMIGAAAEALGPLSLLVNCASVFESDDIETMTRESWDMHMETNLRAPLKLTQDFASQVTAGENNLVVNIVDQRVLKLTPQFLSYTTTKAALFTLTKTLAQALAPKGVRVNAVGPGPTLRNPRQSEEDWAKQNAATILGRGATPEDIASAVLYLVSASAVTGQMITVDGGQHLAWQTPDVLVKE